ncbi:MAG: hypothetical protein HY691_07645 [Chloroflexi bacterium]|nr:hypothetical protein [Chloroflexota bacterium]
MWWGLFRAGTPWAIIVSLLWWVARELLVDWWAGETREYIGTNAGAVVTALAWLAQTVPGVPWLAVPAAVFTGLLILTWVMAMRTSGAEPRPAITVEHLDLLFRSEISYVTFAWLWKDDPYLLFGINVWNTSPYDIELTGVNGAADVNETRCTRDAKMPSSSVVVPKYASPYVNSILQPISEALAKTLQQRLHAGHPIPFSLAGIEWVGTIALTTGRIPLQRGYQRGFSCATQFEVDGAKISQRHSQASVQPIRLAGTGPEVVNQ